jgi:hypothetical protein
LHDCGAGRSLGLQPAPISIAYQLPLFANYSKYKEKRWKIRDRNNKAMIKRIDSSQILRKLIN